MTRLALYVPLHAKPGKEKEVADFLRSAIPLVNAEPGTVSWSPSKKGHHVSRSSTPSMTRPDARLRQGGGGLEREGEVNPHGKVELQERQLSSGLDF
jgi:hypothetical protein